VNNTPVRLAPCLPILCGLLNGACQASASSTPAFDTGSDDGGSSDDASAAPAADATEMPGADGAATADVTGSSILDGPVASAEDATTADSATAASDAGSATGGDATFSKDGAAADATATDASAASPFKGVAGSDCAELPTLNLSWWYDWETGPTGCTSTPFVPMIWGHTSEQTAAGITGEVSAAVAAGYKYVLGFNEPDNASQSSIPVATAISLWPSFNNPAVVVGSPATQGNATGLAWIQSFMSQVNADATGKLRVDFIATHWYGWDSGACDPAANTLQSWIEGIEAIPGNRPIWLTEWGCMNQSNPSAAAVQAFYAGALAMFAKHPRLVRYAWYQWNTYNELVNVDGGALTPLGAAYSSAPAFH